MSTLRHKTVLITGGASGIGRLMGKIAIEKGAKSLLLWDINHHALGETVKEFSLLTQNVRGYTVDVSNVEQVKSAALQVKRDTGAVDILVNNAGIVVGKYFHKHTHDEIESTMHINANALMHVALEFLPAMIERGGGHIVNIASAAGMVGNPKMPVYAASKWAVIGWSDSLRIEMEKLGTGVRVTAATPYYISTGMFEGVKSSVFIPITRPEIAAQKILRAVEKNRLYVRMPPIVHILPFVKGILPARAFDLVVGKLLKVYKTMDEFTGRR